GPTGCQANTRWFSCCGTCRGSAEHPAVNLLGRPLPCEDGTVFPRGSLQAAPDVVRARFYRFAGKQSFNIGGLKCHEARRSMTSRFTPLPRVLAPRPLWWCEASRSEEHTSELQSRFDLVCRLLLEKTKPRGSDTTY